MHSASGQQKLLLLNQNRSIEIENSVSSVDSSQHTAMKPYLESHWDLDKVYGYAKDSTKYYYKVSVKAMRDNLVSIRGKDFHLTVDPLFDFQWGYDFADQSNRSDTVRLFTNTRGLRVEGDIGDKVSFQTMAYENQLHLPLYLKSFADSTGVIPGQGRFKLLTNGGYDFGNSYGWVSYSPRSNVNLQIGHGKHFVGHGYRSMLLSDNASNYPYVKASAWLLKDKINYNWIYAQLQSLERLPLGEVPESLFKRKSANFIYVNFIPHPRVEIGLFEGTINERWDSTGTLPIDALTFMPLLGVSTVVNGFDNKNNVIVGINGRVKLFDWVSVYGQLAVDDLSSERLGYQAGMRLQHSGKATLGGRVEYNYAPHGTYAHGEHLQAYTHMNQSLTHPLGTTFEELIVVYNMRYKRFHFLAKYHNQRQDLLDGGNILLDYEETLELELVAQTHLFDIQFSWLMNPKANVNVTAGWIHRNLNIALIDQNTDWVYIGFRTSLFNKYYDF
jgi:hypothetical protein